MNKTGKGFLIFFILWLCIFLTIPGYGIIGGTTYTVLPDITTGTIHIVPGLLYALFEDIDDDSARVKDFIKLSLICNAIYSFIIALTATLIWALVSNASNKTIV